MKRLALIPLILILTACASVQNVQVITPTDTTPVVEIGASATPVAPDNTPTSTKEPTATSTEVVDPNAPEGTLGKDEQGDYVTMENGDIARKVEYKTALGEMLWSGWTVEKTQEGGISLLDLGGDNLITTKLFVDPNIAGAHTIASLTHIDNIEYTTNVESLTTIVTTYISDRKSISPVDSVAVNAFWTQMRKGEATLSFITSSGMSVEGKLGPSTGFITIVVPYDSLTVIEGNGVSEWIDVRSGVRFRSTMLGVDASGNAIGLIASEKPLNELSDSAVRLLPLFHPASIIAVESQEIQGYSVTLDLFVQYADKKGAKTVPDIIIERNP